MVEKLRGILDKVLEWWKKFSTKQKALIISSCAVVVVAMVILGMVLSRPQMVILKECQNTSEAADVKAVLDESEYTYEMSGDGLTFSVNKKDKAGATLLLGESNITAYDYEWENLNRVFEGGFSMTEADTNKKYQLYMENNLEELLRSVAAVDNAQVMLNVPKSDGTLISKGEESSAWVVLTLNSQLEENVAQGLGRSIATALGNETTDHITILDHNGNLLFSGDDTETSTGTANNNLDIKNKAQAQVASQVKDVVMETKLYDSVSVSPNLDIEYKETTITDHLVYPALGQEQGLPTEDRTYDSSTTGGYLGVPGTDSNDGTTYVTEDDNYTESTISETETIYQNSEKVTNDKISAGRPNYETSSLAVVASSIHIYDEARMRKNGQLEDMTFEEFRAQNDQQKRMEVDPELITMVSNATGIPEENISMVAYEVPYFQYASESGKQIKDFLPIIIAAVIMIMLGYVVFRSTRKETEEDVEQELSVEALLESTKEAQEELEDIGFAEKSETRVLIEKFVDENPEAAASLLRNWLNEEWS